MSEKPRFCVRMVLFERKDVKQTEHGDTGRDVPVGVGPILYEGMQDIRFDRRWISAPGIVFEPLDRERLDQGAIHGREES